MAQCTLKPDLEFTRELTEAGGESLKKCFQCATCSVACPLAPANAPYPRKEMVWASWGLKDKLRARRGPLALPQLRQLLGSPAHAAPACGHDGRGPQRDL